MERDRPWPPGLCQLGLFGAGGDGQHKRREVFIEDMIEAGENLQALPGPIEVIDEPAVAINL